MRCEDAGGDIGGRRGDAGAFIGFIVGWRRTVGGGATRGGCGLAIGGAPRATGGCGSPRVTDWCGCMCCG